MYNPVSWQHRFKMIQQGGVLQFGRSVDEDNRQARTKLIELLAQICGRVNGMIDRFKLWPDLAINPVLPDLGQRVAIRGALRIET